MVRGLEQFRKHFANYSDRYVLIGGTACSLIMEDIGLNFRATKDLDIVLHIEALDRDFVTAFWNFIEEGGYLNRQQSTGKDIFYRFTSPTEGDFPVMLELFSRVPDIVTLSAGNHLTPIPTDEAARSLSAILLDDDYYHFIHSGTLEMDGLSVVNVSRLIPLKARAWIDLSHRKQEGARIDEKDIRKHRNDVIRLYQLLSPADRISTPQSIKSDLTSFLDHLQNDKSIDLKSLGLRHTRFEELINNLKQIYEVD